MAAVDIIIPAYNAAHFLPFAIESVLAQTFGDWKILLIDDGSTDNTSEVVSSFAGRLGSKLNYIRQENRGLPAARNTALKNSSSPLLALLDADDVWFPCRLEESVNSFKNRPRVGLSYGYVSRMDANGCIGTTHDRPSRHPQGNIARYVYMRSLDLPCPTITFRRECVEKVGMFDESMRATEDRDLWFRIAAQYEIALIPKVIAYYRSSPQAMTTDPNRMLNAQKRFIQKHYGTAGCGPRERRVAFSGIYRQRAEALAARRQFWPAFQDAFQSLRFHPFSVSNARTATSLLLRSIREKF